MADEICVVVGDDVVNVVVVDESDSEWVASWVKTARTWSMSRNTSAGIIGVGSNQLFFVAYVNHE